MLCLLQKFKLRALLILKQTEKKSSSYLLPSLHVTCVVAFISEVGISVVFMKDSGGEKIDRRSVKTALFRKRNEIILHFFVDLF